jgi:hypothetical protein
MNKIIIIVLILIVVGAVWFFWFSGFGGSGEYCVKTDTGERMSLEEAREIALKSECFEQGLPKETYMCNEYTGTWWLDLDVVLEGCNPACVIDVATKEAEINWRCTGLVE